MLPTKGRPYTSTSTTANFGANSINKIRDINIIPKVSNYRNDGCGRDNYIKFPNGGFLHSWNNNYRTIYYNKLSMTEYLKSSNINPKFSIYKSNGWGRDSYIFKNCGGFFQLRPGNYKKEFFGNLRNYNYDPFVNENINPKKNDYLRYVKMYKKPKEVLAAKELMKKQRATSNRLAKPRYIKTVN